MNFKPIILVVFLIAAGLKAQTAPAVQTPSGSETVSSALRLAPQAQADSEGVFLSQLVTRADNQPVQHLRIADAPAPAHALVLTRHQINEALRAAGPEHVCTNWVGAEKVKVVRRMRTLAEPELVTLLQQHIQEKIVSNQGEVEIRFLRPWTAVLVPDEPMTVRMPDFPISGVSSSMILRFELGGAKEVFGAWQANVQFKLWREVWIARHSIARGQVLSDSDVTLERREVMTTRNTVSEDFLSKGTFEAAENVKAGDPLTPRSFRLKPWIYRGQVVDGVLEDGLLSISLRVEALEDGLPGQTIRVRNPQTKREFRGKVQNEQTVTVLL